MGLQIMVSNTVAANTVINMVKITVSNMDKTHINRIIHEHKLADLHNTKTRPKFNNQ